VSDDGLPTGDGTSDLRGTCGGARSTSCRGSWPAARWIWTAGDGVGEARKHRDPEPGRPLGLRPSGL